MFQTIKWARSGDKRAPIRAEQILDHMDDLYQVGNKDVKPDTCKFFMFLFLTLLYVYKFCHIF